MKSLIPFVTALLLAGCAAAPERPSPPGEAERLARLVAVEALDRWTVTGRVAVIHEEESWHATLHWRRSGEAYEIRLIGPLGQGAVMLSGSPGVAVMRTDEGEYIDRDPERLLERHLGWPIPVAGLHYWVRGLADPSIESVPAYGDDGRIITLAQRGWRMEYRRWGGDVGLELPEKIFLERDGLKVRVVIDEWRLDGASAHP